MLDFLVELLLSKTTTQLRFMTTTKHKVESMLYSKSSHRKSLMLDGLIGDHADVMYKLHLKH